LSSCVFNKDLRDIKIYIFICACDKKMESVQRREGYEEGKKKKNEKKKENDRKEER